MQRPVLSFLLHTRTLVLASAAFLHCSCHSPRPTLTPQELTAAVASDEQVLKNIETHNVELRREFLALRSEGNWKTRGYFSAQESDRTEGLYFRFHTAYHQLNEIVERYDSASKAHPVSTRANRLALEQSHFLVNTFGGDKVAIDKLNQAYPRSGIPRDTYDRQVESLEPIIKRGVSIAKVKAAEELDDAAYIAQSEIFFHVSRLKKPNAHLVSFSDSQKREVLSLLQPGDILLTFTAGYASDVFIPGAFKHGITFIGTVEQRQAAGLSPEKIILVGGKAEGDQIRKDLKQTTGLDGRPANLIEAVAEGVKFSNLEHIMDTHINRLLVLRPMIGAADRAKQVSRTFSYLGQDYDFRFDFADSSKQVCTEVIYRALNGLDDINFTLTRRGGHITLSADDIVNYWLHKNPGAFELILYAEEAPNRLGHPARILTGTEGKTRVTELMASGGKD